MERRLNRWRNPGSAQTYLPQREGESVWAPGLFGELRCSLLLRGSEESTGVLVGVALVCFGLLWLALALAGG